MNLLNLFRKKKPKLYELTVVIKRHDFMSCLVQIKTIQFTDSFDVEPNADSIREHRCVMKEIQDDLHRRNKDKDRYWIEEWHEEVK